MGIEKLIGQLKMIPILGDNPETDPDFFKKYIDEIHNSFHSLSKETTVQEFYKISEVFRGKDPFDFFDMNFAFRHSIEAMDNYPPAELFLDTSSNELVEELRARCWLALSLDAFAGHEAIPVFTKVYTDYLLNDEEDFTAFLTEEILDSSNLHELRLFLEFLIFFKDTWQVDWIVDRIVSRLDKAHPMLTQNTWVTLNNSY